MKLAHADHERCSDYDRGRATISMPHCNLRAWISHYNAVCLRETTNIAVIYRWTCDCPRSSSLSSGETHGSALGR